jgi:ionotropic glutamate receptor
MERFCIQTQTLLSFLLVLLLFISRSFASTKNDDVDGGKRVQIRVGLVLDLGSLKGKIVKNSVSMALSYFYAIHNDYKTRVSVSLRNSHGEPLLALASGKNTSSLQKLSSSLSPFTLTILVFYLL